MKNIVKFLIPVIFLVGCSKNNNIKQFIHNQEIVTSSKKLSIYSKPFVSDNDELLYVTNRQDKIIVKKFLQQEKSVCLEVEIPSGKIGFIPFPFNPYANDQFSFKEKISIDGNELTALNLIKSFSIDASEKYPVNVYNLPSESSEIVANLREERKFDVTAITNDYEWIFINDENFLGWVQTKFISRGIGGAVLWTPELYIKANLVWDGEL